MANAHNKSPRCSRKKWRKLTRRLSALALSCALLASEFSMEAYALDTTSAETTTAEKEDYLSTDGILPESGDESATDESDFAADTDEEAVAESSDQSDTGASDNESTDATEGTNNSDIIPLDDTPETTGIATSEDEDTATESDEIISEDEDSPVDFSEDDDASSSEEELLIEESESSSITELSENDVTTDTTNASEETEDEDADPTLPQMSLYVGKDYQGHIPADEPIKPSVVDDDLSIESIDQAVKGQELNLSDVKDPSQTEEIVNDFLNGSSVEPLTEDTSSLPAAFPSAYGTGDEAALSAIDDALKTRLPAGRTQGAFGTCWSFGAMVCTEAYKINKQNSGTSVDDSERHLIYNSYNTGTNPLNLKTGDSANLNGATEARFFAFGGNDLMSAYTLLKWRGVETEANVPSPASPTENNEWTNNEFSNAAGRLEYSLTIDPQKNQDMIKRFVKEYGATTISYFAPDIKYDGNDVYYNPETNAFYSSTKGKSNHTVAIVGWDDNFSASNFKTNPGSDGAWLIRNSWNSNNQGVKDKTVDAYFWMSYADKTIDDIWVYKLQDPKQYSTHHYFYDTVLHENKSFYYEDDRKIEAANVYTIQGGDDYETLDSVSLETVSNGKDSYKDKKGYQIEIYTDLEDPTAPDSGDLVAIKKGELPFTGYYTIHLDSPILLKKGTTFSVVTSVRDGYQTVDYESNLTKELKLDNKTYTMNYYASALKGQSFYRKVGAEKWDDNAAENAGNFCIDVATSKASYSETDISSATFKLKNTTAGKNKYYYTGKKITPTITGTIGDKVLVEGTDYTLTLDNDMTTLGKHKITITGAGSYTGTSILYATIVEADLSNSKISVPSVTYNGKAQTPAPSVTLNKTTLTKDKDYSITYKNNKNAGTATVTITGLTPYSGTASQTFEIGKAPLSVKAKNATKEVDEKDPAFTYTVTGFVNGETAQKLKSGSLTREAGESVGSYAIKLGSLSFGSNYEIKYTGAKLTIQKSGLTAKMVTLSYTKTAYTGEALKPTVTVKDEKTTLKQGTHYTVSYKNNTDIGTATVTVKGTGAYSGTINKNFTITPPAKNKVFNVNDNKYKILDTSKSTVTITGTTEKTTLIIPNTVKIGGKNYSVTAIGDNAFRDNSLKKVNIGKNITKIGAGAFLDSDKLDIMNIYTQNLALNRVGEYAFGCIASDAIIKVPAEKKAAYSKILRQRGLFRTIKIQ